MLSTGTILTTLAGALALFLLFNGVGWVLFRLLKRSGSDNIYARMFWQGFTGLLVTESVFAAIMTGLKTVMLPVPLLVVALIWFRRTTTAAPGVAAVKVPPRNCLLLTAAALLIGWLFFLQAFHSWNPETLFFARGDHASYGRLAERILQTRVESPSLNLVSAATGVGTYHYGDIWLYALASKLTGVDAQAAVVLIGYPVFALLFMLGLCGLAVKHFHQQRLALTGLFAFSLFFSGIAIFYPNFLLPADSLVSSSFNYPKVLLPGCFITAVLYCIRERKAHTLYTLAALSLFCFINIAPSLIIGLALFFAVSWLVYKRPLRELLAGLWVFVAAAAVYVIFYRMFSAPAEPVAGAPGMKSLMSVRYVRTAINIVVGGALQFFPLLPFVAVFFLLTWRRTNIFRYFRNIFAIPELLWLFALAIGGLLAWAILAPFTMEAVQFFHNIYKAVSSILVVFLLFWVLVRYQSAVARTLVYACVALFLFFNYRFTFGVSEIPARDWAALSNFLPAQQQSAPIFVSYQAQDSFRNVFVKNTLVFQPLEALDYRYNPYANVSLNAPYLPVDTASRYAFVEQQEIRDAPFTRFLASNTAIKAAGPDAAMRSFVDSIRPAYLMVADRVPLPPAMNGVIGDSLAITGWKIYRIKK